MTLADLKSSADPQNNMYSSAITQILYVCTVDLFLLKVKSSNKGSVLTTIVDVMKMHSSEEKGDVKDMSCERYEDWRVRIPPILIQELKICNLKCLKVCCSQVCSCCAMRSLYFTWHNVCSVCRRSDHSFL